MVIGFDGRHNSKAFAADAAAILSGAGFEVYAFERVVPTPILSDAVTALS